MCHSQSIRVLFVERDGLKEAAGYEGSRCVAGFAGCLGLGDRKSCAFVGDGGAGYELASDKSPVLSLPTPGFGEMLWLFGYGVRR